MIAPPYISIHALLAESDRAGCSTSNAGTYFYPRSPCGERHMYHNTTPAEMQDFYPRSPCGERLCDNTYTLGITDISIHALLAESDCNYGGDKS